MRKTRALSLLLFVACTTRTEQPITIAGAWKSEPYESQLGRTVTWMCFRDDGTFDFELETSLGVTGYTAPYSLTGDKLKIEVPGDNPRVAKIHLETDALTIRFPQDSKPTVFRRVGRDCALLPPKRAK